MNGNDFFSFSELVRDRKFLASFGLSLLVAVGAMAGTVAFLSMNKIRVNPIGAVKITDMGRAGAGLAKPISQIPQAVKTDGENKQEFVGYVVNFEDLCKTSEFPMPMENTVVLVKNDGTITAATAKIGPKTCELIKKLTGDKAIYATSNTPFAGVPTEPKYVTMETARPDLQK